MKKFRIILLLSLSLLGFSCENLYEEKYTGEWEDEYVWQITSQAQAVLNDLYVTIAHRPDSYSSNFLDAATDNAMTTLTGTCRNLATGNYSSQSNPLSCWSTNYEVVQMASYYIEQDALYGDLWVFNTESDYTNEGERYYRMGQAYFLRAFFHFDLLQVYGGKSDSGVALGVPILTEYMDTDEAKEMLLTYARPTYEESVQMILDDLDKALTYFDDERALSVVEVGRANSTITSAFKARVGLYAASPAYQDDSVVKINGMGDYTVVDQSAYEDRWATYAGLIYSEAIALLGSSTTDDDGVTSTSMNISQVAASDLADVTSVTPSEFLFRFYFSSVSVESYHFMPRYYGKAYTVPSQNLVDAYPMANGYPITDRRSNYDPSNPYEGRDERFYLGVYYHGADYGLVDYETDDSKLTQVDLLPGGADSRSGTIDTSKNSFATNTGYYLAKFVSKNFTACDLLGTSASAHYWPELRYAEVYLSYAEAANEAWGPKSIGVYTDSEGEQATVGLTAYAVMKELRSVSGGITGDDPYLDEVAAMGKDAFRELIHNERRIELAFENHRFFDMRRCLMDLTEPIYGVEVSKITDDLLEYNTSVVVETRDALDDTRHYYLPMPYDEVMKGLENNRGW